MHDNLYVDSMGLKERFLTEGEEGDQFFLTRHEKSQTKETLTLYYFGSFILWGYTY